VLPSRAQGEAETVGEGDGEGDGELVAEGANDGDGTGAFTPGPNRFPIGPRSVPDRWVTWNGFFGAPGFDPPKSRNAATMAAMIALTANPM
jgi:hypothetical protein